MDQKTQKYKGVACIIMAAFFFSLMTVFVHMAGDLPTMQKTLFRNLVAAVLAWIMLFTKREPIRIRRSDLPDLILRSTCGILGMICNFYAIDHLNISDANMLNKLSPFFAMLMSILILKEKVTKKEWAIVCVAFIGALFVIRPGFSMSTVPALLGLLGGFGAGVAYTFVRKLGKKGVQGTIVVMFFSTFSTLFCLPFFIIGYQPMTTQQLLCLCLAGTMAAGGQLSITAAYTYAPAKEISVYDYMQVLFAAVWGFLFFGQQPDGFSVIGYIIIIGAAVYRSLQSRKEVESNE